ncbi:exodeoxyribonuclease III, partial [Candidatus Woesearchaeota archaeon CG_4_10_14_0_2_um_filter_57_5]
MRLISWNVNGIRAILNKGFGAFVARERPDMLCLQEVKATQEQALGAGLLTSVTALAGYHVLWHAAERPGYSGTAVLTKVSPTHTAFGIGSQHDTEGRVMTLDYGSFYLVNCYTVNAQRALTRLPERQEWDRTFKAHLAALDRKKPVIACGDLNVAHEDIDLARPGPNRGNAGFTDEEREGFSALLSAGGGFVDTFRHFTKDGGHYTWWAYMGNARANNVGWRIDYFLTS